MRSHTNTILHLCKVNEKMHILAKVGYMQIPTKSKGHIDVHGSYLLISLSNAIFTKHVLYFSMNFVEGFNLVFTF
jgi:hypothetical protein